MTTEVIQLTQTSNALSITPLNSAVTQVSGFAVHVGVFNDITIEKEELDKCVNTIVGSPIIKAHNMYDNPDDIVIGKVTFAECKVDPDTGTYGLYYKGEIDSEEEKLLRKMDLGFISSTSIGFMSEHVCSICGESIWSPECEHWFWDEDFHILAQNIKIHELSIVAVPADENATVNVTFSKIDLQAFKKLENQKESRRAIMSDFEKKYNEVADEFAQYKINSADEINKLKEEFSQEKEKLENEIADKLKEALSFKNEVDALSKENDSLKEEVSKFQEAFNKIEEDKLAQLREKVIELNKEVYGGLKEERINELSESTLKEYIEIFSHQKEHIITLSPEQKSNDKYSKDSEEDETALGQLAGRIGLTL